LPHRLNRLSALPVSRTYEQRHEWPHILGCGLNRLSALPVSRTYDVLVSCLTTTVVVSIAFRLFRFPGLPLEAVISLGRGSGLNRLSALPVSRTSKRLRSLT